MKNNTIAIATICISVFTWTTTFAAGTDDFVTVWETTTANETITIPVPPNYTYNYNVDCGANASVRNLPNQTGDATCTYPTVADNHEIRISGSFPAIRFFESPYVTEKSKIRDVKQWGTGQWRSFSDAFSGASNMEVNATDAPNLSATGISINNMFQFTTANPDVSKWDTSNVTDMSNMFGYNPMANPDVSQWDTSNVTNMSSMFFASFAANPDVSQWNTSKVTDISQMFPSAGNANPDVSGWDVSKIRSATGLFGFSGLSRLNYDKLLASWSTQDLQSGVTLGAAGRTYCNTAARAAMITKGWVFTGDDPSTESCPTNSAPTITTALPTTSSVVMGRKSNLDLSAAAFADTDGDILTLTLSSTTGTFTATGNDNITISGSATDTLGISGTVANLHTYLDSPAAIQYRASTASGTISATLRDARTALSPTEIAITTTEAPPLASLDIDGNGGSPQASTDGILIARYIASVRGESLIAGAVAGSANRETIGDIEAHLEMLIPADPSADKPLDIDGNGIVQASTDGILIARYIASVRGASLIAGAVAGNASSDRDTAGEIEAYLLTLDI